MTASDLLFSTTVPRFSQIIFSVDRLSGEGMLYPEEWGFPESSPFSACVRCPPPLRA